MRLVLLWLFVFEGWYRRLEQPPTTPPPPPCCWRPWEGGELTQTAHETFDGRHPPLGEWVGGSEAKKQKFVYLKSASKFRPLY